MIAAQVAFGMVTRLIYGPLQDRSGRCILLIIGGIVFTLNIMAFMFAASLTTVFVLRAITGVSQGIYFNSAGTMISDLLPKEKLVEGLGLWVVVAPLSGAFSPAFGLYPLQNHGSFVSFYISVRRKSACFKVFSVH